MQSASVAYRESMKASIRNRSYARIYLGIFNREAQQNSNITGGFTYFSNADNPLDNIPVEYYYATCEKDFVKCDGNFKFLPKDREEVIYNQGIVCEEMPQGDAAGEREYAIIHIMTAGLEIKGLTIDFGDTYPYDFDLITNIGTYQFRDNDKNIFETDIVFRNLQDIEIVPVRMREGQRIRILKFQFGNGLIFTNNEIMSLDRQETCAPMSDELPMQTVNFKVNNRDLKYNVDNPNSYINFLEMRQEAEVSYGYELDDGSIEYIDGGQFMLKTWSSDDSDTCFTAVDRLQYEDSVFYFGRYNEQGISLYQLALDVIEDWGIENYYIDPYLKRVIVHNPLPQVTHKECMQIIANAGRCILWISRKATLCLISSFVPDIIEISASCQTAYSSISNVLADNVLSEYADGETDHTRADGKQFFIPKDNDYRECGFVSEISSETGIFTAENPSISIVFESQWKIFGMTIRFGSICPKSFVLKQYNDGTLIEAYEVKEKIISRETVVHHEFCEMDKLVIEFTQTSPNNRVYVEKIMFGEQTDYTLTYDDLTKTPVALQEEKYKQLDVYVSHYTKGLTEKELTLAYVEKGFTRIDFSNPVHDLSAVFYEDTEGNVSITDSGAFFCIVESTVAAQVSIKGFEYTISTNVLTEPLFAVGNTKTWKNPLISTRTVGNDLLEWLAGYYRNDRSYQLAYRGEPRIDVNDLTYLENRFVDGNLIRVYEHRLSFSQGLSINSQIKARRVSYEERK